MIDLIVYEQFNSHSSLTSLCFGFCFCFCVSINLIQRTMLPLSLLPISLPLQTQKPRALSCKATLNLVTDPDSFQVGRLLGSYGFINITSYSGLQSSSTSGQFKTQDVGEGSVKIRLYEGRVVQGPLAGSSVVFKVYPGQRAGGTEADMMAANELNSHAFLQSSPKGISQNLLMLIGGFETTTGEQWLAFRNDGIYSAADYAKLSSEKLSKSRSLGVGMSWNYFEREEMVRRKRFFVIKLLQGAMRGLAFMHERERLHQSLGPSSVVLNTITERDAAYLVPRLRDLAFSVDIRYPYVEEGRGILSEQLWRRAAAAGAITAFEKRDFAIADDIYEAGLLLAYLAFVPFCESGIIDSLSLQRLLENTFQLDIEATREYCLADDRLLEAVKFLDLGDGAGWELLQAMLNPDYRKRPIAEAVVKHRFMTGGVL
ncbi:uncharacterized protein LOC115743503 [Rhodamnia argentea]|uniref:Uncharacterized protein LOC115743503 n=1 Tax=Rhodamnia argentea TaxID=178133 RepID=A0A8B8PJ38_9MYRT|nr:uncharacterized protein LOC115743503 [Rhodamnia argentea]